MRSSASLLLLAMAACGGSVEVEDEPTAAASSPIYGEAVPEEVGQRYPVCIPLDGACLRLSVVANGGGRLDDDVTGEIVAPGCVPDGDPANEVVHFHGYAGTGHGILIITADLVLASGDDLALDVKASRGECL